MLDESRIGVLVLYTARKRLKTVLVYLTSFSTGHSSSSDAVHVKSTIVTQYVAHLRFT